MSRASLVSSSLLLALATGCKGDNLWKEAYLVPTGSMEREVGALPANRDLVEWYSHWRDEDQLLLRITSPGGEALAVLSVGGDTTTYCDSAGVAYDGPSFVGWRNDVGLWDVIDGRLYLLRDSDSAIVSCGEDGVAVAEVRPTNVWPKSAVPTDGGYLTWLQDQDHPIVRAFARGDEPLPWTFGPPLYVGKNRTASALVVVTQEGSSLVLREVDAITLEATERVRLELGAEALRSGGDAVVIAQPGVFVVRTEAGGLLAASRAGAQTWPVDPQLGGYELVPFTDGTGFYAHGGGMSVNLLNGAVAQLRSATPLGYHLTIDQGSVGAMLVSVYRNHGTQRVEDGPITTWPADFTTQWDWLDTANDATYEGFGTEDGNCGVARWGEGWGVNGRRIPYDVGDLGWFSADSVLYWGPCERPMTLMSRELWVDASVFPMGGQAILKQDFPVFSVQQGERTEPGFASILASLQGWRMWSYGWGVGGSGQVVPLWAEADRVLVPRRGSTFWTLHHDGTIHRVEAARALE